MLSELRLERKYADSIHVEWSPNTLHQLLDQELPGAQVIVVSNREPYIHNRVDGRVVLQTPASGLVSALEPVMRACGGVWVAHGSGSADRDTVDGRDRVAVPPDNPAYALRRVWLSDEEQDGYYYGFANEGLWPLCHIAFVRPTFRERDWAHYVAVNQRFADVVVEEADRDDPIVLVQDYHFALLPRMMRERLPRATIITFWHIPWPNPETFGICPWREQIIDGLLGSSILGFHTQFHCNNFIEAVDRFMESRIDRERSSVTLGGHETLVRPYPISIEWPPAALAAAGAGGGVPPGGQEPFRAQPPTRGSRLGSSASTTPRASSTGCARSTFCWSPIPEWRGKLVFIQAAAPTRSKLSAYSGLQEEAAEEAEAINARWGDGSYKPDRALRSPPRTGRGLRALPGRGSLHRLQPARRHESRRQGIRRRARRRAGGAGAVELRRRLARTVGSADRQSLRHARNGRDDQPGAADGPGSPARADAGDARSGPAAQRLSLGGPDAARRRAPEAAREHRGRGGGLSRVADERSRIIARMHKH